MVAGEPESSLVHLVGKGGAKKRHSLTCILVTSLEVPSSKSLEMVLL